MKTTWLASLLLVTIFWGAVLGLVVTYLGGAMVEALTATPIVREPLKAMAVGIILAVMSGLLVTTHH
ncbi:BetT protein [Lactiplantibacillus plantarum]|uniref:BetT protein n=1 Tax=Lactiplantibacillus plantarum TaxID=1590 RepID=UPI003F52B5E5